MRHETVFAATGANDRRERADLLRSRAHLLCGTDRALTQMYFEQGSSLRQIARVSGVTAANVGRRIRRIMRRLTDETYSLCRAGQDDFTGRELALLKDYFVRGLTMTHISRERGLSYHRVRGTIRKAREYARSLSNRGSQSHNGTTTAVSTTSSESEGIYDDNL